MKCLKYLLGGAHKYVWLASPDRPNFCSEHRVGWSASIKIEKKLKSRFISIGHLLVIEIGIFGNWYNFIKGYVSRNSNLAVLWQCLAAWKTLKLGSQVNWRGLCVLFRVCYSRYLKLVVVVPRAFYLSCHREELESRISWK